MSLWKRLAFAVLSGACYSLGFAGWELWPLSWVAFAPLVVALDGVSTKKRSFLICFVMGFVTHLGDYYWIVHLLITFADLSVPLSVLGYVLLCAYQCLGLTLAGWIAWGLWRRTGISLGWTMPVGLVASEFTYPLLFPSYTANSQYLVPVVTQVVELGGVLLLSAIIAFVGAAIGEVALSLLGKKPFPRRLSIAAAATLASTIAYGLIRIPMIEARDKAAPILKVAIVQANVGAGDKHLHAEAGVRRFREMTDEAMKIPGLGLVVWPESGFNRSVELPANLTGPVATEVKVPMIVGALRVERTEGHRRLRVWNSVLDAAAGGEVIKSYDKVKLLIFGEYLPGYEEVPSVFEWLLKKGLLPYLSVYDRGTSFAPLPVGPYQLSASICYEDILPRHIGELMASVDDKGHRPHALVNATNDSWYGPVEPGIHLALAMFRAIEHRRWLIRSTATGLSAFVDSAGRLVQKTDFEKAQTLVQDVPMIEGGATVYGVIGDLLGWLSLAAVAVGLLQKRYRPRPSTPAAVPAR